MGVINDLWKTWKISRAENKWKKQFDKKPVDETLAAEKAAFTAKGEPWVGILRMDIDPNNLSDGMFELDWNDIFIARLVKAGYVGKDDKALVDQWFQNICAGVVSGTLEQELADPEKRRIIQRKRLTKDKTEFS